MEHSQYSQITFLCGLHPRTGISSPVRIINVSLIRTIFAFLLNSREPLVDASDTRDDPFYGYFVLF